MSVSVLSVAGHVSSGNGCAAACRCPHDDCRSGPKAASSLSLSSSADQLKALGCIHTDMSASFISHIQVSGNVHLHVFQ